jgi:prophage regulatory protein
MTQKILRLPAVKVLTGLSRSSLYQKISLGEFPAAISLGARAVGWLESDIAAWIENKVGASRSTRKGGLA